MLILSGILIILAGCVGIYQSQIKKKSFFNPKLNEKWGEAKAMKYSLYFSIALIIMGFIAIVLNFAAFSLENPIEKRLLYPTSTNNIEKGKSSSIAFRNFKNYLETWSEDSRVMNCGSSLSNRNFSEVNNGEFPAWECFVFSNKDLKTATLVWDGEKVTLKNEKKIEETDKAKYQIAAYMDFFDDAIDSKTIIKDIKTQGFDDSKEYAMQLIIDYSDIPVNEPQGSVTIGTNDTSNYDYIWQITPKNNSQLKTIFESDGLTGKFIGKKVSISK